ncbi:MAG: hypothetical protein ACR5KV_01720 [Wolbachia sp.]
MLANKRFALRSDIVFLMRKKRTSTRDEYEDTSLHVTVKDGQLDVVNTL